MAKVIRQYWGIVLVTTIILFAPAYTRAQDDKESGTVKLPSKLKLRGERTTHPAAQWFPDAGLGLFIHWDTSCLHHASVWSCYLFE